VAEKQLTILEGFRSISKPHGDRHRGQRLSSKDQLLHTGFQQPPPLEMLFKTKTIRMNTRDR